MDNNSRFHLHKIGLIIIGDELLLGRRRDKHLSRATEYFPRIGVDISWVLFLGDDPDLLERHFRLVREREEDCFTFGGIGATPDDLTRQAMAGAHDQALIRHPAAVGLLEQQFGEAAYPNRILMAELPEGAGLIPNAHNNIPGFYCGRIHCLPGFPEMAWPMVAWVIENRYSISPQQQTASRSLIVRGAKESELVPLLTDCQGRFPALKFSCLPRFSDGRSWQAELGVRGSADLVEQGRAALVAGIRSLGFDLEGD